MAGTNGYAIKYKATGMFLGCSQGSSDPVDIAMNKYCMKETCIAVWPALTGNHVAAGTNKGDSDIVQFESGIRKEARTKNIVDSAVLDALKKSSAEL